MSEDEATEPELAEPLIGALRGLAVSEDEALEGVMLQGLRRRMGLSEVPARIDRFSVIEERGAGAMGVVYTVHDPRLQRTVALKLGRVAGRTGVERGLREARALARLSHPNVVTVFEAGIHQGRVFVAMELVEGEDLRQWLRRPRRWREVCEVMLAAGRGLAAAHDSGVVHRDFKPENVLVGEPARVADFGLANPRRTASGRRLGPTADRGSMGRPMMTGARRPLGDRPGPAAVLAPWPIWRPSCSVGAGPTRAAISSRFV